MTTPEIATKLVALCRMGQNRQAYQELFATDALAIEPPHIPYPPETHGLDNLLAKHDMFEGNIQEVHSSTVSEPLVSGNYFSVSMGLDFTQKDGKHMNMNELCMYEVKDGKIVKEQFFY